MPTLLSEKLLDSYLELSEEERSSLPALEKSLVEIKVQFNERTLSHRKTVHDTAPRPNSKDIGVHSRPQVTVEMCLPF